MAVKDNYFEDFEYLTDRIIRIFIEAVCAIFISGGIAFCIWIWLFVGAGLIKI
jgi:hypothetical protein